METLAESSHSIVGATGFGFYQLFEGRKGLFSTVFDWVVFDEASQMLIPPSSVEPALWQENFCLPERYKTIAAYCSWDITKEEEIGIHHVPRCPISSINYDPSHRVRLVARIGVREREDLCYFSRHMWL